jgi:hypothetical protein
MIAIAEYMNTLLVVGCTLVTGVAQEWQITIESWTRARYTAYCRMTPSPQRTLDADTPQRRSCGDDDGVPAQARDGRDRRRGGRRKLMRFLTSVPVMS